jgi:dTDP-4-dehydrorhamnose reductase
VVNDQFGSPTWAGRLAQQIDAVLAVDAEGVFHATAEGWCSWFDLASRFLSAMGVEHRLAPITTPEYPTPARRPANSILENARLKQAGINRFVDWREDVDGFARRYADQLLREAAPR